MTDTHTLFDLTGKKAIVTGCATGIGKAICQSLASAGADIFGIYNTSDCSETAKEVKKLGRRFVSQKVDLSKVREREAQAIISSAEKEMGGITILVNAAGINLHHFLPDFPDTEWEQVIDVNLRSMFFLCQEFSRVNSKRNSSSSIINIASLLSYQGGIRASAYTISKHGVLGLTKSFANEVGKYGIRVNCITPGYIQTAMTKEYIDSERGGACLSRIPLGRWGDVEDIGNASVFLASDAASYVTGTSLVVDGGYINM